MQRVTLKCIEKTVKLKQCFVAKLKSVLDLFTNVSLTSVAVGHLRENILGNSGMPKLKLIISSASAITTTTFSTTG